VEPKSYLFYFEEDFRPSPFLSQKKKTTKKKKEEVKEMNPKNKKNHLFALSDENLELE
jgi:hypothetical protein